MAQQSRFLKTTRVVLRVAELLNGAFIAGAVVILGVFWWNRDKAYEDPGAEGSFAGMEMPIISALELAVITLVAGLVISVLVLFALRRVQSIVGTAIASDPFAPENGGRWAQVGWIALSIQVISLGAGVMMESTAAEFPVAPNPVGTLTGFLMVLLFFVVAQIFRRGSEMRQDLEGTV